MINGKTNDEDNNNNSFAKTICSICYEDLKPIVEDLQSISICGHVFHELCLQQWFEYCSSTKKCTCPVCKQGCKAKDASRLYFQSTGDLVAIDSGILTQRSVLDPDALRIEISKLEKKVLGLDLVVARQAKDIHELNLQLCLCKELGQRESALKDEALKEAALLQQLLHQKIGELDKSTVECFQLQGRNMALAKELASIKLVLDLDLDEEEVHKLASFGNGDNNQDTIDILRRSLVMRNRSYKELMAKCNALGRGESRSTQKLEKAKEKISRLKERVKELEIAAEVKDNEVLRQLQASKKTCIDTNPLNAKPNFVTQNKVPDDQCKQSFEPRLNVDPPGSLRDNILSSRNVKHSNLANNNNIHHIQDQQSTMVRNEEKDSCSSIGASLSKCNTATYGLPNSDLRREYTEDIVIKPTWSIPNVTSYTKTEPSSCQNINLVKVLNSKTDADKPTKTFAVDADDNVVVLLDDPAQGKPALNIRKVSSTPQPLSNQGGSCFSGGLLGPDGTNRYLGKWCKRGQNREVRQDVSTISTGDLISVGADGRGGRIKVLRSLNQSPFSLDSEESSTGTKRLKLGGKTNSQPSRGCLQIQHFFGRVSN